MWAASRRGVLQLSTVNHDVQQAAQNLVRNILGPLEQRIYKLERGAGTSQLQNATIDNGALTITDAKGIVRTVIGAQPDGTITHVDFNSPVQPSTPSAPVVSPAINGLTVAWDGKAVDDIAWPADWLYTEVHVSDTTGFIPDETTRIGVLHGPGQYLAMPLTPDVTYYAKLIGINTSGGRGPVSDEVSGVPERPPHPGSGIAVTIGGTAPDSPSAGDLWFDETNNYELNQWDGTQWAAYQFGTNAVAAGSMTAAQIAADAIASANIQAGAVEADHIAAGAVDVTKLAAGLVVAGVVNGTKITGAQFVATGTAGEFLAYNGDPANGNLAMSLSSISGTDEYGNQFVGPGLATYGANGITWMNPNATYPEIRFCPQSKVSSTGISDWNYVTTDSGEGLALGSTRDASGRNYTLNLDNDQGVFGFQVGSDVYGIWITTDPSGSSVTMRMNAPTINVNPDEFNVTTTPDSSGGYTYMDLGGSGIDVGYVDSGNQYKGAMWITPGEVHFDGAVTGSGTDGALQAAHPGSSDQEWWSWAYMYNGYYNYNGKPLVYRMLPDGRVHLCGRVWGNNEVAGDYTPGETIAYIDPAYAPIYRDEGLTVTWVPSSGPSAEYYLEIDTGGNINNWHGAIVGSAASLVFNVTFPRDAPNGL